MRMILAFCAALVVVGAISWSPAPVALAVETVDCDRVQLLYRIDVPASLEATMDGIVASHLPWMQSTHYDEGPLAVLHYTFSKEKDLTDPFDESTWTGRWVYILAETYATPAGIDFHFAEAANSWVDFPAFLAVLDDPAVDYQAHVGADVVNTLWGSKVCKDQVKP